MEYGSFDSVIGRLQITTLKDDGVFNRQSKIDNRKF